MIDACMALNDLFRARMADVSLDGNGMQAHVGDAGLHCLCCGKGHL
jgi:hypothetical protein